MNILLGIIGMFIIATIGCLTLFAMTMFTETLKEPTFNPELQEHQREYVSKLLRVYETGFKLTPSYALHHMPLYKDSDERYVMEFYNTDHFRLKVYKVSCYSDISGITNHRGLLYSLMYKKTVLKNYTEIHEFISDYKRNFSYFDKIRKIIVRKKALESDFV
ncbi:MAG: hypothetical protein IKP65_02065 [Alphaproteobacteria bacterium]|nr:hypothetical protein [Alphaproteobacteria bacterium]